jgi:uncharacterized membrane protein
MIKTIKYILLLLSLVFALAFLFTLDSERAFPHVFLLAENMCILLHILLDHEDS